jgi:hypothetical protein
MGDELEFTVATASVDDHARMEHRAPNQIHIAAGTRLAIRFDYQLEETSQEEEEDLWTFRLEVKIPGKEDSVTQRTHIDRALFADGAMCHVGIDFDFVNPGIYELNYNVHASVARRKWRREADFQMVAEKDHAATRTVHVDEPVTQAAPGS